MEDLFAKIGLKAGHLIVGGIGAAIAVHLGEPPSTVRGKFKRTLIVIFSVFSTGFLTPLVLTWLPVIADSPAEYGVGFILGLYSLSMLNGIMKIVNGFVVDPIGTIKKIKDAFRR